MLVSDVPPQWFLGRCAVVLILVLVDVGLGHPRCLGTIRSRDVLILVLVDVGLGLKVTVMVAAPGGLS